MPKIEGSEDFDEDQTIDAIVRTDYDAPIAVPMRTALRAVGGPACRSRVVCSAASSTGSGTNRDHDKWGRSRDHDNGGSAVTMTMAARP